MTKKSLGLVLLVGVIIGITSCGSVTAGLATLKAPIRVGAVAVVTDNPLVVIPAFDNFIAHFDDYSKRVEEETGFPLDKERFLTEFKNSTDDNYVVGDAGRAGVTVSWEASKNLAEEGVFANIGAGRGMITIIKTSDNPNEKIWMMFNVIK